MSTKCLQMGIPSTMNDDYQLTLKNLFDQGLIIQPNEQFITKLDNNCYHIMSHTEFKEFQPLLASSLASIGFKCGDIAATFMWNTPRHLSLYYTVPNMGGCLLPLNVRLHPKELNYILTHSAPKIIFIDANLLPQFKLIPQSAFKSVKHFIICGENMKSGGWTLSSNYISPAMDYDQFIPSNGNNSYLWPDLSHKSGAYLFYTSGTTGNPKGVVYSHRSVYLATMIAGNSFYEYQPYDTVLMLHPFFHVAGGCVPFCAMLYGFRSLFPNNCYDWEPLLEFCFKEKATKILGVPTIVIGLCEALKKDPKRYQIFRGNLTITTGGSAVPAYLVTWLWDEWKIKITHGYGMTECFLGSVAKRIQTRSDLYKSSDDQTKNVLLQGIISHILESKLVDPDDHNKLKKKDGIDVGELIVRGPCVTKMYFKNEKPSNFIDNEWLKTGDICSINQQNILKITDRSKDLIKSGGEWISSVDLENYVMKLNEIELACVVGVAHKKWRERPVVIVKLKPNQTLTKKDVVRHISTKFARFQIPDDVIFWDDIPLTSTGKLSKRTVRDILKKQNYKLPDETQVKTLKSKL